MSLNIGVNLCPYAGGPGGAETYLRNLVAALGRIGCTHRVCLFIPAGIEGHFAAGTDFDEIICGRVGQSRPKRVWLEQTVLPSLVREHRIDVILSNYVSPVRAPCRQIVVVHDMLYKVYPRYIPSRAKLWYWRVMVPASIRRAETVLTISQHSANDIRRFFPRDAHKVVIGAEAVPFDLARIGSAHLDADVIARLGVNEPFALCTAGLDAHKNIRTLVRAFESVAESDPDLSLVLTDPYRRTHTDAVNGVKPGIRDRIVITGSLSYRQLAACYRRAVAHITPSRFEGFGLSVIEAQHFGCPGITSLAGPLPEVTGGADLYFHPDNASQLADHLRLLRSDEGQRQERIKRGRANVRRYDWESVARQFLDLCERSPSGRAGRKGGNDGSRLTRLTRSVRFSNHRTPTNGRIRELPLLVLMPHSRCNCRCVMCDIWKDNAKRRELSVEQISGWRRHFEKLRVRRIMLTGGEPLMHGDIERLLRLIAECGIHTTLASTGLLLRKHSRAVAEHCGDVVVSLDGSRAVHDAIRRVPGAFDKLAEGVAAVHAINPQFPIVGRCTIQRGNFRNWPDTIDAARQIGLQSISFQAVDTMSTAFNHPTGWEDRQADAVGLSLDELTEVRGIFETVIRTRAADMAGFIGNTPESLRRIADHFAAMCGQGNHVAPRCNAPWISAVIETDGSVRPCFFHRVFGNVNDAALPEILNSTEMVGFRKTLSVQDDPICRRCVCSLYISKKALLSPAHPPLSTAAEAPVGSQG